MTNVWVFRTVSTPTVDVTGFDVEATDGHIGKIDEASNDTGRACLVVDTGFWIFGKKRVIPAGTVDRVDVDEQTVFVSMSKDQIKDAPDWRDDWSSDEASAKPYDDYYSQYGW